MLKTSAALLLCCFASGLLAQQSAAPVQASTPQPAGPQNLDQILKRVDDLLWFTRLGDIADVDIV